MSLHQLDPLVAALRGMSPARSTYSLSELSDNFSEIHRAEAAKYVAHLASLRHSSRGSTAIPSSRGSTAIPRSGVAGVSRAANTVFRAVAAFKNNKNKKTQSAAKSPGVT
jgi:hypothetical protein